MEPSAGLFTPSWSWKRDSNTRPAHYECAALPTELFQQTLHSLSYIFWFVKIFLLSSNIKLQKIGNLQKNYKKQVDEGVRNAELKHDVQDKVRKKHSDWEVDESVQKMEVPIDAKRSYLKKHGQTYEEDNKNYYKRRKENEKNS